MTKQLIRLAAILIAFGCLAGANSITFGLGGDPGQYYTFSPDGAAGTTSTEPVGPYPGWLGENIPADDDYFFCMTFLKTATWGGTYSGTTILPATPQQLEAAYLGSELFSMGDQNATLAEKGAISLAIWQVMDPAPGDVPRDPAAQSYVTSAVEAYNSGRLNPAEFANTRIFVPNDPSIQTFMVAAESSPSVPEPETLILVGVGTGLILLSRLHRSRQKRDKNI